MRLFETFPTFVSRNLWLRNLVWSFIRVSRTQHQHSIIFFDGCHLEAELFRLLFCTAGWSILNRKLYYTIYWLKEVVVYTYLIYTLPVLKPYITRT